MEDGGVLKLEHVFVESASHVIISLQGGEVPIDFILENTPLYNLVCHVPSHLKNGKKEERKPRTKGQRACPKAISGVFIETSIFQSLKLETLSSKEPSGHLKHQTR